MKVLHRTSVSAGEGLDFVISDGSLDRHGTRINPDGWDLRNFKKNPIALFAHDSRFPIGTWSNLRTEGDKLLATLKLAAKGTSDRLDEIIGMIEQGILRATSVGFNVIKFGTAGKDEFDFVEQELLEASIVSIGSNANALAKARSLNVSPETLSLVFGESANERRGTVTNSGESAANLPVNSRPKNMKTLSQRIVDAQESLTAKKDKLAELTGAETLDVEAVEALNAQIDAEERGIAALKASEAKIGASATSAGGTTVAAPAVARRPLGFPQREVSGLDLLVRSVVVRGIAYFGPGDKSLEKVLEERYPGHEATATFLRADQTIGTTTGSHWADDLVQTVNQGFLDALNGFSVYPALRSRGIGLNFDGVGTIKIPRRTAGTAGGSFVGEGSPIRVGKLTTAAAELAPRKMGVIVAFSRELAKRATPAIEALVRRAILEDTAATLDSVLLDATAGDTVRPAGLLYNLSAAASGYGGADHVAVKEDFKALLAPFIAANAADGITVIMNPAQALAIAMMDGPANTPNWFGPVAQRVNIVESTHATSGRLIAIRNSDFATAMGDTPEFDVSEQATIHMEDTTPLEIVSGTPTVADPVRSLWQTGSTGVRMMMDVSWTMARTGMVQWIDGTSY